MMKLLALASALPALVAAPVLAADAALIEAAKKEGKVTWYTTQPIDPLVLRLTSEFQKKYGIRIEYARANSTDVAMRIINEAKAGRVIADIYDGTTTAEPLKKERLTLKWLPEVTKTFAPDYVDPDGYWAATNDYVIAVSYNTDLIKPGTEPRHWDELLDPRYRGKIAWGGLASTSAGAGFIGTAIKELGEERAREYLKKLALQRPAPIGAAARVVIDQVIAGEYAIALQSFPENAIFSASKGAPVKWIPMKPTMTGIVSTVGVLANSPNPNAAKLLVEYMLEEEGQKLYRDTFYIPAHPKVPPLEAELTPGKNKVTHLTPTEVEAAMPKWMAIFKELF